MTRLIKFFAAIGLLLALASPSMAQSGCGGQFPANQFCGTGGSQGLPGPRSVPGTVNTYTPEEFYQSGDGANWGPAINRASAALHALAGGGNLLFACGTTYNTSSVSTDGRNAWIIYSNVTFVGCGPSTVLRIADNTNTSSAFFISGIGSTSTTTVGTCTGVCNAGVRDLTIDFNGANNSCGGTCYHSNAEVGIFCSDNFTAQNVLFINNPGSNGTVFGPNPPAYCNTNTSLLNNTHEHNGDIVNPASTDFTSDFLIGENATVSAIRYKDGPRITGNAFEFRGKGLTASNLSVTDYVNCGIISNLPTVLTNNDINLGTFKCANVKGGIQVGSFSGGTNTNINISGPSSIKFLSGFSGIGIDASSAIVSGSGANTNLSVDNVTISSDVTTSLGNDTSAISVGPWLSAKITNNQTYNTQGPCVRFIKTAPNAALMASNNQCSYPGRTSNAALQAGIVADATSGVTADNILIAGNGITGTVVNAVIGAQNTTSGLLLANNASGNTGGEYNWTGTGMSVYSLPPTTGNISLAAINVPQTWPSNQRYLDGTFRLINSAGTGTLVLHSGGGSSTNNLTFPAGTTDFTATGGTSQVVKQTSAGGAFTVGQLTCSDLSGGCTGSGGITALTGAITASGSGSAVASLGSFTSANLSGALTDETGSGSAVFGTSPTLATPVINGLPTGTGIATINTASTLVARDASGNFAAGTITASLTGHASLDLAAANNLSDVGSAATSRTNLGLGALATVTPGTGIATALAVNVGTAGAPVINGGALGSPSSAGTIPAFTLGGTIAGGGNQINNVIIGSTSPLAGSFTTVTASTSVQSPSHTSSSGDAAFFGQTTTTFASNNGTFAGRISTGQLWEIGVNAAPDSLMTINGNTGVSVAPVSTPQLHLVGPDGANAGLAINAYGSPVRMEIYQANGTQASKTATSASASIFSFNGYGWNTSAYALGGAFQFVPSQTWTAAAQGTGINFLTTPNGTTSIAVAASVQASGGISIGTATDPGIGGLQLNGQQFIPNALSDSGLTDATACIRTSNGQVLKGSGTLGICLGTSGAQFKTALTPMAAGLDEISRLSLLNYRYKSGFGDNGERLQYGLTAQQVATVMPDLVRYDDKGEALNFDIGALLPVALHAIQQLKADNDNLKLELHKLEMRR